MKLALGMIVRNEERMLRLTFPVYANVFQIRLALDTGSTDGTGDVLRKHGFTVMHAQWQDDYSKARNVLLDVAEKIELDWMMQMDADEAMFPNLLVPELIKFTSSNFDLVRIPRINLAKRATLRDYTFNPNYASRFIRISSGVKYKNKVHEECEIAPDKLGTAENFIYHYGYCKPASNIWLNSRNYKRIAAGLRCTTAIPKKIIAINDNMDSFWNDMSKKYDLRPFSEDHPLKAHYG